MSEPRVTTSLGERKTHPVQGAIESVADKATNSVKLRHGLIAILVALSVLDSLSTPFRITDEILVYKSRDFRSTD